MVAGVDGYTSSYNYKETSNTLLKSNVLLYLNGDLAMICLLECQFPEKQLFRQMCAKTYESLC